MVTVLGYGWLWWCDLMVDSAVGGFRWGFFFLGVYVVFDAVVLVSLMLGCGGDGWC